MLAKPRELPQFYIILPSLEQENQIKCVTIVMSQTLDDLGQVHGGHKLLSLDQQP